MSGRAWAVDNVGRRERFSIGQIIMVGKSEMAVDRVDNILTKLLGNSYISDNKQQNAGMIPNGSLSTGPRLLHLALTQGSIEKSSTYSTAPRCPRRLGVNA